MITFNSQYVGYFDQASVREGLEKKARRAQERLEKKECLGAGYTGWVDYPNQVDAALLTDIKKEAKRVRDKADCLVVVGIGGSYLGTKAVLSFLGSDFPVYFSGENLSVSARLALDKKLEGKTFFVNYVSKSGGTLEPALAFRFLKEKLIRQQGDDWADFVLATTDPDQGKLRALADREGVKTFPVPSNIGGRYSVLTAVGLFPLACAGVDIDALLRGAKKEREDLQRNRSHALDYAVMRRQLFSRGKKVELLVDYDPIFSDLSAWWAQLFGESEGKEGQGIFPASASFTTDLHSLGQFIQEGSPLIMETVLWIKAPKRDLVIPSSQTDDDGLAYLEGASLQRINEMACLGTMKAHLEGNTPTMRLIIPSDDAESLGALLYFFMYACAVSALMQGVNPFDQPGVEAYKKNVKKRLETDLDPKDKPSL